MEIDTEGKSSNWGWLVLLASTSTLLCCALPILLVSLGMGTVVAAMASNLPFLVTLSQYKGWMFIGSFVLLLFGAWSLYRSGRSCPVDPELLAKCNLANRWNQRFFRAAVLVWVVGFFAAYVLPLVAS